MRRVTRLILPLVGFGMVAGLPTATQAFCIHGSGHCWWCNKGGAASYGYSPAVISTGVVPGVATAPTPVGGSTNPNAPIPASAPALAYPGAGTPAQAYSAQAYSAQAYSAAGYGYAAPAYAPAGYYAASSYSAAGYAPAGYASSAYAAPTYAAPGYAPGYAAPGYAPSYGTPGYGPAAGQPAQSMSYLGAYDNNAPLAAIPPGTVLANSQMIAGHIFQNLRKFGAGLDESGLLDLAARLLGDATGIRPTGSDIDALRKIVGRFRSEGGGGGGNGGGTLPVTGTNTGTTVVADGSTVTITAPPGIRVLVIQGGRSGGNADAGAGVDAGNRPIGNDAGVTNQPPLPATGTPTPRQAPASRQSDAEAPPPPDAPPPAPVPARAPRARETPAAERK